MPERIKCPYCGNTEVFGLISEVIADDTLDLTGKRPFIMLDTDSITLVEQLADFALSYVKTAYCKKCNKELPEDDIEKIRKIEDYDAQ